MSTDDEAQALSARVRRLLADVFPGQSAGPLETLPGGHSGLTYRTSVADRALVIKAVPPGRRPVGRHDVIRQARIIGALAGSAVPVPRLVAVDDIEPAWFAMEWVAGQAVEPVLDGVPLSPRLAGARAAAAAQTLAQLHGVDVSALPDPVAAVPLPDELAKWETVLHAGPAEFVPAGEALAAALGGAIPASYPPTIVHGDYRLGNILCDAAQVRAVIDWEIWSIGDPRIDVGYFGVFSDHRNFPGIGVNAPGLPDENELAEIYGQARGTAATEMAWFASLGRFRMASIMAHNLRRHREGRHHDDAQETLPPTISRLMDSGLRVLSGARSV
jgi:aminoglycoside phosphotransferase (APT) family kinase protein